MFTRQRQFTHARQRNHGLTKRALSLLPRGVGEGRRNDPGLTRTPDSSQKIKKLHFLWGGRGAEHPPQASALVPVNNGRMNLPGVWEFASPHPQTLPFQLSSPLDPVLQGIQPFNPLDQKAQLCLGLGRAPPLQEVNIFPHSHEVRMS